MKVSGYHQPSYCGYTKANTIYRLTIAIFTFFFSLSLFTEVYKSRPMVLNGFYFMFHSLWFLAAGLDIMGITNGQTTCVDTFEKANDNQVNCENSIYGITIAIDIIIFLLILFFTYCHYPMKY